MIQIVPPSTQHTWNIALVARPLNRHRPAPAARAHDNCCTGRKVGWLKWCLRVKSYITGWGGVGHSRTRITPVGQETYWVIRVSSLKEAGNDVSDRRGVSGEQAIGSLSKRYPVERGTDSGGADLFYPPRCRPDNEPDKDFNPMRIFARSLTTRKCRKVVQNGVIRADKTNCRPVGVWAILLIGLKFLSCSLSDRQRGG
jgi:hypothetical protein